MRSLRWLPRRTIELVRSGRSPESLAKEFEPSTQAIRRWVKQADLDEGKRQDGPTTGRACFIGARSHAGFEREATNYYGGSLERPRRNATV
jgi:hypothetical protein